MPPGLAPELRDYLTGLGEAFVQLRGQVTELRLRELGCADGTLSRRQAMDLLDVSHNKFNQIREELTVSGSAGRPRYTLASIKSWMHTNRKRMSFNEVEQLVEVRIEHMLKKQSRAGSGVQ